MQSIGENEEKMEVNQIKFIRKEQGFKLKLMEKFSLKLIEEIWPSMSLEEQRRKT